MAKNKEKIVSLNLFKVALKQNLLMDSAILMNNCLLIAKKCGIPTINGFKTTDGAITDIVITLNGGVLLVNGFVQDNNMDILLSTLDIVDIPKFVEEILDWFKPTTYRLVEFDRSTLTTKVNVGIYELKEEKYVKVKETKE